MLDIGDWSSILKFNMGKGYRRPIPQTEAKTLQNTVETLNQSHFHFSAVNKFDGRVCNISINGEKMVRNFIREYRNQISGVEFSKDILSVEFNLYFGLLVKISYFQIFNKTKVGMFKFLPYRIKDLTDLYRLTSPPPSTFIFSDRFEVDATEGCLQGAVLDIMKEHYLQEMNTTEENCTDTHAPDHDLRCAVPSRRLLVKSDIERAVSQFFMYAMVYINTLFKMIQTGSFKENQEVCALTWNKEEDQYKPYTTYECCSLGKARPYSYKDNSAEGWHCHGPYKVTEILAIISLFLSYFTVTVFPLAIKWIPSTQSTDHPNVR